MRAAKLYSFQFEESGSVTAVTGEGESARPPRFALLQNYPNPFNSATAIPLRIARPGHNTVGHIQPGRTADQGPCGGAPGPRALPGNLGWNRRARAAGSQWPLLLPAGRRGICAGAENVAAEVGPRPRPQPVSVPGSTIYLWRSCLQGCPHRCLGNLDRGQGGGCSMAAGFPWAITDAPMNPAS